MPKGWNIIYYETEKGQSPVEDFINSLEAKAKSKVINTIDLLEEFGIRIGSTHSKKLSSTNIWELRVLGKDNIRILYITIISQTFLLLHGFVKKKQKTDAKEIKIAEKRLMDYKTRN